MLPPSAALLKSRRKFDINTRRSAVSPTEGKRCFSIGALCSSLVIFIVLMADEGLVFLSDFTSSPNLLSKALF